MTSATIENVEPTQKKRGFLSRMFNEITAPIIGLVNELRENLREAATEQNKAIDKMESYRVETINEAAQWVLDGVENQTPENLKEYAQYILDQNRKLKTNFFDDGEISVNEIIQKVEEIQGQTTPHNNYILDA